MQNSSYWVSGEDDMAHAELKLLGEQRNDMIDVELKLLGE